MTGVQTCALPIFFNQAKAPPHIDYINKKRNQCRINIPVFNCEHSVTEYYNYTGTMEQGITYQDNGLNGYLRYMDEDPNLVKVDEVVVDRPTIMRVQQPHRVIIDNNYVPRVVLTFFTRKDPVYLLEEEDATC